MDTSARLRKFRGLLSARGYLNLSDRIKKPYRGSVNSFVIKNLGIPVRDSKTGKWTWLKVRRLAAKGNMKKGWSLRLTGERRQNMILSTTQGSVSVGGLINFDQGKKSVRFKTLTRKGAPVWSSRYQPYLQLTTETLGKKSNFLRVLAKQAGCNFIPSKKFKIIGLLAAALRQVPSNPVGN